MCGKDFEPKNERQKYCSAQCKERAKARLDLDADWPSLIFTCPGCGKRVVTMPGTKDMRTKFCSHSCAARYYSRHKREALLASGYQKGYLDGQRAMRLQLHKASVALRTVLGKNLNYRRCSQLLAEMKLHEEELCQKKGCIALNPKKRRFYYEAYLKSPERDLEIRTPEEQLEIKKR